MRKTLVRAGVLVATVLICAVATPLADARAQAVQETEPADSAAIRSLWSTLDTRWNERDAERFSELFAVDGNFEFVDRGESMEGRATIHQHFAERFARFAPDLRHRTTVREIRDIAPDVRTVDGQVEILRTGSDDSTQPTVLRTFAIFAIMLQTGDGWKIRMLRVYQLSAVADGDAGTSPAVNLPDAVVYRIGWALAHRFAWRYRELPHGNGGPGPTLWAIQP